MCDVPAVELEKPLSPELQLFGGLLAYKQVLEPLRVRDVPVDLTRPDSHWLHCHLVALKCARQDLQVAYRQRLALPSPLIHDSQHRLGSAELVVRHPML